MKLSSFSKCVFLLIFLIAMGGHQLFSQCPNYSVSVTNSHATQTVCPFGFPTGLGAQLKQGSNNISGAVYTWQPGNIAQQNPVVNPLVTTIYTVSAVINGCTYTNTTAVNVMTVTAPTISYTPAPFNSTTTATFPVTQTGIPGGIYSIAPSNPSVTINSSTGLITAWGNSFGTYTVTYQTNPFNEWGGWCEYYYAKTVIVLKNSDCPITVPVSSFTLCPDDKVVFTTTVNFPNGEGGVASLTDGLQACYPLDCSVANSATTGAALNGTVMGNVTCTTGQGGAGSSAYHFGGTASDYIQLPNDSRIKSTTAVSFVGWVKFSNISASQYLVFAKNSCVSYFEGYALGGNYVSGGYKIFLVKSGSACSPSTQQVIQGTTNLAANTWYQVGFSMDNNSLKLYVNGVLQSQLASSVSFNYSSNGVVLGGSNVGYFNLPFSGDMDNLRFYDRVLSAQEFESMYSLNPGCSTSSSQTGFSWSSPANSSTLNCTTCNSPTLTFGGGNTIYTLTATLDGKVCGTATIRVTQKEYCEKEEILGCCFSNYGAAVWLNSNTTYINVHCNLLNELGYMPASVPALQKGEFQNVNGTVRVLLDWIHNGKNDLYTTMQGTTSVFGADQKIKGNSSTQFYELRLNGNGTKSIWINEYANSTVDLTSNVLATQNHMFSMKNPTVSVIRTNGYASSGTNGYFSWVLNTAAQTPTLNYLYPMGATASSAWPFRYRPIVISNNSATQGDEVSVNFMNIAPSVTNDPAFVHANPTLTNVITNQAPNVLQINNAFYHKIKNTVPTATNVSNLSIKSYYLPVDGQFQSLAEWEKDPAQTLDWWGSTPGASASTVTSNDPGTPGMIYAMANGTLNFNHKPFTLSRGGFYLNTNSFGNVGGAGTTFSLSAVTPTSGTTPTGGGLGNPYGTGSSSGNGGSGGNTIFSPNPVAGEYIMAVNPANTCAIGGNIRFVIDQNGNISPASVKYGISPGIYLGELSEAVYTIDNQNSGITFSATPRDLLKVCVNTITVTTSVNSDHILNPGENIVVTLPAVANASNTITFGQFKVYNKSNVQVFASTGNMVSGVTSLSPVLAADIYRFELQVMASTAPPLTEIIRGQLIVK